MRAPEPHILHIVADGSPGGGTTMVLGLCADLVRHHAMKVTLITQDQSPAFHKASDMDGVDVRGINFFNGRWRLERAGQIADIIAHTKPDLIHLHGARAAFPFLFSPLKRLNTPLIYTVHGYHFQHKLWGLRGLARWVEKHVARRVDRLIFVSHGDHHLAQAQQIVLQDDTHAQVIYNGIDPTAIHATAPIPPNQAPTPELIFVGRMHRQKNPFFVIDIMAALQQTGVRLTMIGGGALEALVRAYADKKQVADRIDFTGALPHEAVLARLRSAKILLLPSQWEGLPIAPMEALCCGVPTIASDIPGTREVVHHNHSGVLVPRFVPDDYAREICALLEDPERYARLSAAARADERFIQQHSVARYAKTYASVLAIS